MSDADNMVDWRNAVVADLIDREGFQNIHVVPFFEVTQSLVNFHPNDHSPRDKQPLDCTHFCEAPFLWQPLWSGLASLVVSNTLHHDLRLVNLSAVYPLSDFGRKQSRGWVNIDPKQWYDEANLCVLNNWNPMSPMGLSEFSRRLCDGLSEEDSQFGYFIVGVASTYTAVCPPPLRDHPQFFQAIDGFADPTSKHLFETLKEIQISGRVLVLVGDSLTRQVYYSLLQELHRLDSRILVNRWTNITDIPDRVQYVNTFSKNEASNLDYDGGGSLIALNFVANTDENTKPIVIYYVCVHKIVEYGRNWAKAKLVLDQISAKNKGMVIMANVGLHYNERKDFQADLPILLHWLNTRPKTDIVLWRETTAQHFEHSANGYFNKELAPFQKVCVPHNTATVGNADSAVDWRNEDAKTIIQREDYHRLIYVPFHDFTVDLYRFHASKAFDEVEDCTHYCMSPTLFQPLWYAISNATLSHKSRSSSHDRQRQRQRRRRLRDEHTHPVKQRRK